MNLESWVKNPGETKLVGKDWTLDLMEGDSLAGTPTAVVNDESTMTCAFAENDGNISKFWIEGGLDTEYDVNVTLTINTTLGETLVDVIQVKILKY